MAAEDTDRFHPMTPDTEIDNVYPITDDFIREVENRVESGNGAAVRTLTGDLSAADLADLIEKLPSELRRSFIDLMQGQLEPDVLPELDRDVRDEVVPYFQPEELAGLISELETDDALNVVAGLEEEQKTSVLELMPPRERLQLEQGLNYPEYTAGRLMQRDLIAVPEFWTVGETIDYLRNSDGLPGDFFDIFVVDPRHRAIGKLPLSRLLRNRRAVRIGDIMDSDTVTFAVNDDQEKLAFVFRQEDLVSAPVVDLEGRLVGVVTIDDVVDVIDEEHEDDMMKLGGVQEDDLYRAALATTRSRVGWLMINMCTAVLSSIVISQFEETINKVVALAVLMPIVSALGGNAGTQTLTVAVRALAMRELSTSNFLRVMSKEVIVGAINGVLLATVAALLAGFWFGNWMISAVIAAAMVINLIVAGFFGLGIPVLLDRLKVDPAIASSVLLTAVTDVVGFVAFLGLATYVLL